MSVSLTLEQLQALMAQAVEMSKAPAAKPAPAQRGWVPTALPAAQSIPLDLRRTLSNVMAMRPSRGGKSFIFEMLKKSWAHNSDAFTVLGGVHNSPEGDRTYFSVSVELDDMPRFTLHVYGAVRGTLFRAKSLDVKYFGEQYENVWIGTPTPSGSVA